MFKFELYKDSKGEYRWRFKAPNGKTIADSGEGYKNKEDCKAGIGLVKQHASAATIVEV